MRPAGTIPILIVSDCEPDLRETNPADPAPWLGFERYFEFLSAKRALIAERSGTPARFSWFWRLDPQIEGTYGSAGWPARQYASQIAEAKRHGDEAGIHLHVWRWDAGLSRWIGDYANAAWVESCIRSALAEYQMAFGEPCRIFRFGDGWHDRAAVALLERLGIKIDLTLEPGLAGRPSLVASELSTGTLPDRTTMPTRPYRPAAANFLAADAAKHDGLWMLPMTTGAAHASAERRQGWLRKAPRSFAQLNLGFEPEQFTSIFERALAAPRPFAAITVRTDVGSNEGLMRCVERNLQSMLDHRLAGRLAFMGPSEALPLLTN